MTTIDAVVLDVPDADAATALHTAVGVPERVRVRSEQPPSTGFRGFTLSLVVPQPSTVDRIAETALAAGATALKPVSKSFWGYGGVLRAPDGAIWKIATSAKKDTEPSTGRIDEVVLLLGVADVKASKQFYVEHGLTVAKSFGSKYVQFASTGSAITLALYGRRALAKDAGVDQGGDGSHRLAIIGATGAFTDPDGFTWQPSA